MKEQVEKIVELLGSGDAEEHRLGQSMISQMEDALNATRFEMDTMYRLYYIVVNTLKRRDGSMMYGIRVETTEAMYLGRTASPVSGKNVPQFATRVSGIIAAEELWT